jgi:NAD+-dependent protein deacetylase sirtuin 4
VIAVWLSMTNDLRGYEFMWLMNMSLVEKCHDSVVSPPSNPWGCLWTLGPGGSSGEAVNDIDIGNKHLRASTALRAGFVSWTVLVPHDGLDSAARLLSHAACMPNPIIRIPFTGPLPPPLIIPPSAATKQGAVTALSRFLTHPATPTANSAASLKNGKNKTVLLTGAGISVASGLADYRGVNGTYTQNRSYRPIYYHEFLANHESRKRYWARSFLGWRGLHRSKPNATHLAIRDLGALGLVDNVVTQNVDSFHGLAHPGLNTVELHGFLRALVCLSCRRLIDRDVFQKRLAELNPAWAKFLQQLLASGALDTENPEERRKLGFRTNPDGDADVPGAPYYTFRYPPCPHCLTRPPILKDGSKGHVKVDADGAWAPSPGPTVAEGVGVLKPNVIMFGESIPPEVKAAAEDAIDLASKILVVGSSLATYSAWRLVKRAHERGMGIGILNLGGVRKEETFFGELLPHRTLGGEADGHEAWQALRRELVRVSLPAEEILPQVVGAIRDSSLL